MIKRILKLGHIIYSNCFPPHAGIITGKTAFPFNLVEGIPTDLNRMLLEGTIDVSPSSSIEYAMNPGRYVLFPGLSIAAKNRVRSIILQSRVPIDDLDKKTVALTTASATSVVLLRILLEVKQNVHPNFVMFEQGKDNPFARADGALFIGDIALKLRATSAHPYLYDLGELWHEFTGLPSVYALWQVNYKKNIDNDLAVLYDILMKSKVYGLSNVPELARANADRFGIAEQALIDYWTSLSYNFGDEEKKGLLTFYGYAAELGAIEPVQELRFWEKK
jgi:chorismate dehydratase